MVLYTPWRELAQQEAVGYGEASPVSIPAK